MSNVVKYILDIETKKAQKGMKGITASLAVAGPILGELKKDMLAFGRAIVDVSKEFYKLTKGAVDAVNRLNDLSTASNLAATTINAVEFAFMASGQSMQAADTIMKKFPLRMKEIRDPATAAAKMMKHLDIEVNNVDGSMRDSDSVFKDIIKNLQNMEDAEMKTLVATELFKRDAGNLLVALGNSAPLEKFTEFTEKFGVNAKKSAEQAAAFQRSIAGLSIVASFLRDKFVDAIGGMNTFNKVIIEGVGGIVFVGKMLSLFTAEIRLMGTILGQVVLSVFHPFISGLLVIGSLLPSAARDARTFMEELSSLTKLFGAGGFTKAGGAFTNIGSRIKLAKEAAQEAKTKMSGLVGEVGNLPKTSKSALEAIKALIQKTKELGTETEKTKKIIQGKIIPGFFTKDYLKDIIKFDQLQTKAAKGFSDLRKEFARGDVEIGSAMESANSFIDVFKEMDLPTGDITSFINQLRNLRREQDQLKAVETKIDMVMKIGQAGLQDGFEGLMKTSAKMFSESNKGLLGGLFSTLTTDIVNFGKKSPEDIQAEGEAFNSAIANGIMMLPEVLFNVLPALLLDLANKIILALLRLPMELWISIHKGMHRFAEAVGDILVRPFDKLIEFFKGLWDKITSPVSWVTGKMGGGRIHIPHGEGGLRFTGQSRGLAMLHEGEVVVPRSGQTSQGIKKTFGGNGSATNIVINSAVVDGNIIETLVRQIEEKFEAFGSSQSTLFSS